MKLGNDQNKGESLISRTQRKLTICAIGPSEDCHIQNRTKCFAERGHHVYLIANHVAGIPGVMEIPLRPLFRIPKRYPIVYTLSLLGGFIRAVRRSRPDVVHVHYAYQFNAWMAAVLDHHPLIVSTMGGDILFEERELRPPRGQWLTLQLLKSADLITAKSNYLISVLNEFDELGSKTIKVVWGVNPAQFRRVHAIALRQKLDIVAEDQVILSPKKVRPLYNIHLIVEAMPHILRMCPNAKLLITEPFVDMQYKAEIVNRARGLDLQKHVIFVGGVENKDMPYYYSLADVVVGIPSSDGLPQTLFEAMACEVPHVLSRLPCYEEVVAHEESAYFVDISPESIANGVVQLLSNTGLRNRIIRNGLQIVRSQADFETEVKRVEQQYHRLPRVARHHRGWTDRIRILFTLLLYWSIDTHRTARSSRSREIMEQLADKWWQLALGRSQ
jgi:glycosyltransferase involved in cell wall biosynthesis